MFGFIGWIIIGLLAGLLARLIIPGEQAMGWVMTIVLGLVGSLIGGFLSTTMFGAERGDGMFNTAGLVMSTVGALIALGLYLAFEKRNTSRV